MTPKKGLNIPLVTVFDETGAIIEADQRSVVRYAIQNGDGADSVFLCGTTGEFNRMTNQQRQQLFAVGVDEVRRVNATLPDGKSKIEAWVGVTAETKAETLENLRVARELKADLAVIAPLTIRDLPPAEIVDFFRTEIAEVVGDALPISLYDNPDIAYAPDSMGNLTVETIDELRQMPFVVALKASVTREVLQSFLNAFSGADGKPAFDVYYGNAPLIFVMDEMRREAEMDEKTRVAGVVSGTANLFPREWCKAWEAAEKGNVKLIEAYRKAFADFEKLCRSSSEHYATTKLVAGIKRGMFNRQIIDSAAVGAGTPALNVSEADAIDDGLNEIFDALEHIENQTRKFSKDA